MNFDREVYIIVSNAFGKLDLLLLDTITAIREIGYDTKDMNRYRYEIVPLSEQEAA